MSGSVVPEPSTLLMLVVGLFGAAAIARWRADQNSRSDAVAPSMAPA
jgi:hypothetical protein